MPIGLAGPLLIDGEHAQGEFYVPLATTEGTLVASYNRGMRLLSECGGVQARRSSTTTCSGRRCSSSSDALEAREFGDWVDEHFDEIQRGRRDDDAVRAS